MKKNLISLFLIISLYALPLTLSPSITYAATCDISHEAIALDSEEKALIDRLNAYRQQKGLGTLTPSLALTRAAAWYSHDMASRNKMDTDHIDSLNRSLSPRLTDCGVTTPAGSGENLAFGNADATKTLEQWKNSPGHNTNMLHPGYKYLGIARSISQSSPPLWYWALEMAETDSSAGQPVPTTNSPTTQSSSSNTQAPTSGGGRNVEEHAVNNLSGLTTPEEISQGYIQQTQEKSFIDNIKDKLSQIGSLFSNPKLQNRDKLYNQSKNIHQANFPQEVAPHENASPFDKLKGFLGTNQGFYGVDLPIKVKADDVKTYENTYGQTHFGINPFTGKENF